MNYYDLKELRNVKKEQQTASDPGPHRSIHTGDFSRERNSNRVKFTC
ncbi:uncharacterized protein LMUH8_1141 [Listeria monocytogenes]|uniref:Uncharacterized protein n=1 Tax=Listeria monocytogenes TaxID=1639 RepID=A0A9P3QRY1_LISMN|nr:hypothetical protein [Listeria monocytogenes]EFF98034.1 predicted protein [Listeria monocytogenes J2818]CDK32289.1 Predicted protein [Listeria monocytogenes QOC2]EDN8778461.1 hypothetical protein [Listeria monocytogenes]EDO0031588.1 hypothetical protein [Listeria monocytogenes]